jgi:hypothetical protein
MILFPSFKRPAIDALSAAMASQLGKSYSRVSEPTKPSGSPSIGACGLRSFPSCLSG